METETAAMDEMDLLEVREITPFEYKEFASALDIHPIQNCGLYDKLKMNDEDVRIFGGFDQEKLKIAAIGKVMPAWKVFRWIYIPFGFITSCWDDTSLISQFIERLPLACEDDSIMFSKVESFIETESLDSRGFPTGSFDHQSYYKKLAEAGLEFSDQEAIQYTYASIIDLQKNPSLITGHPEDLKEIAGRKKTDFKDESELLENMSDDLKEKIGRIKKGYIYFDDLEEDELPRFEKLGITLPDYAYKSCFKDDCKAVYAWLDTEEYAEEAQKMYDQALSDFNEAFAAAKADESSAKKMEHLRSCISAVQRMERRLNNAKDLEASAKEVPLAGAVFLTSPSETLCIWSAEKPENADLDGLEAIHWEMIRQSIERGALYYNMGYLPGNFQPEMDGYSEYEFNKGFGARIARYGGACIAIYKPGPARLYQAYLKTRNI